MAPDKVAFDAPDPKAKPCPICGKAGGVETAPFCSKRCADVDLHRWLGGVYAVPSDEPGQVAELEDED